MFQCLFFHASYATAAFQCFIFYTSYVLFLFFMFVISTVFSLTHPLVLCNTFEYNFYSIFYNILLFQSVILANYICCKIYNICVVFAVYFSLRNPLLHFFYTSISALPNHTTWKTSPRNHATQKSLTTQPCHTKSLTTQNIVEQKPYRAKIMPYEKSYHPKTMLHEKLHHAKYRCTKLHHAKYHYAKILQQKNITILCISNFP